METMDKYMDCEKKDVLGKVPEDLWYAWLGSAPEEDKADEVFMKKLVLRRGAEGKIRAVRPDPLREPKEPSACG